MLQADGCQGASAGEKAVLPYLLHAYSAFVLRVIRGPNSGFETIAGLEEAVQCGISDAVCRLSRVQGSSAGRLSSHVGDHSCSNTNVS